MTTLHDTGIDLMGCRIWVQPEREKDTSAYDMAQRSQSHAEAVSHMLRRIIVQSTGEHYIAMRSDGTTKVRLS
jgi:hypothetical protein